MFSGLYKKIRLKENDVWRKVVSDKIIVTLVTQALPPSFLSRPCLIGARVNHWTLSKYLNHYEWFKHAFHRPPGSNQLKLYFEMPISE